MGYSAALTRTFQISDVVYALRLGDTLRLSVSRGGALRECSYTFSSRSDFTEAN